MTFYHYVRVRGSDIIVLVDQVLFSEYPYKLFPSFGNRSKSHYQRALSEAYTVDYMMTAVTANVFLGILSLMRIARPYPGVAVVRIVGSIE